MESLRSNKPLLYSIVFSFSLVTCLIFNILPQLTEQFQIVIIPDDVSSNSIFVWPSKYELLFYRIFLLDAIDRFLRCSSGCGSSLHYRSRFSILLRQSKIKTILIFVHRCVIVWGKDQEDEARKRSKRNRILYDNQEAYSLVLCFLFVWCSFDV